MLQDHRESELFELVERLRLRLRECENAFASGEPTEMTLNEDELKLAEALAAQIMVSEQDPSLVSRVSSLREEISMIRDKKSRLDLLMPNKSKRKKKKDNVESRMDSVTEMLLDSRRTLFETEVTAAGIERDLGEQRTTMERARDKLLQAGGLMGSAHRTLRNMQNRQTRNKLFAYGALATVFLMFLFLIVRYLSTDDTAPPRPPTIPPLSFSPTPSPTANETNTG